MLRWFTWYCHRLFRKHFHALRLSGSVPACQDQPLVAYMNHASWWDPIVGLLVKRDLFPDRTLYAPMAAEMLDRYPMFRKLGFFGVHGDSRRGAIDFLRGSTEALRRPNSLLAVTPQSRFADIRERPPRFKTGLGHLPQRLDGASFVAVAMEYAFWEERLPEVLVRFSPVMDSSAAGARGKTAEEWTEFFESTLAQTQDELALVAQRREPTDFRTLLQGSDGQNPIYDAWRWARAKLERRAFQRAHGNS